MVETGTFRGTTTEFLWHISGVPVYSVESEARFYQYASMRLAGISDIHLVHSDSRDFLRQIASDVAVPRETVFFYLDAHRDADLPLLDEVVTIWKHWTDPVIMIDDFEVPGDGGYGFDDYGEGRQLSLDYLPIDRLADLGVLVPTLASGDETGAKRGCAVLVKTSRVVSLCASAGLRAIFP
jgi:hypothetical protein